MKPHYPGCKLDDKCTCQDFDNGQPNEEINNRPQDGRVCDCEDAPCCGHYEL